MVRLLFRRWEKPVSLWRLSQRHAFRRRYAIWEESGARIVLHKDVFFRG